MMDKAFLEFWGNMLLNAARGGNRPEDFAEMMKSAAAGGADPDGLFRKFADPDVFRQGVEEYLRACRKAGEDFQASMKELLSLMDLVPKKDYDELKRRYEDLRKSMEERQGPLGEGILKEEMKLQAEGMKVFEGILSEQARQFQNLMSGFSKSGVQKQGTDGVAPGEAKKKASGAKKAASAGRPRTRK